MKIVLTTWLLLIVTAIFGQQPPRPILEYTTGITKTKTNSHGVLAGSNAIFSEDFETTTTLSSAGFSVKTKSTDGGFKIGNAAQANVGQTWRVPTKSKFVFTNDDRCNCNKSADSLILPSQNLLASKVYQLRFSAFFNSIGIREKAFVFAKNAGKTTLLAELNSVKSWEEYIVPLFGISGNTEIVFSYTDGGVWSSGLAIDDISICEPSESVNLGMGNVVFNGIRSSNFYKQIPSNQGAKLPLAIDANLINLGRSNATNTKVQLAVGGFGSLKTESTSFTLFANKDSLVEVYPNYVMADGLGEYKMVFNVHSDSTETETSNDTLEVDINLTDTTYSRIGGEIPDAGFWFGQNINYDLSSLFEIKVPDTVNSISVFIHENSEVGAEFDVILLNEFYQDNVLPQVFPPQGTKLKVQANDLGKWNSYKVPTTYLKPGKYFAGIRTRGEKVLIGVSAHSAEQGISFINIGTGYAPSKFLPFVKLNLKSHSCSLDATLNITASTCNGSTGSVNVSPTNGTAPFKYQWGENASFSTSQQVTNLKSGVYGVTVSDSLGCSISKTAVVSDASSVSVSLKNLVDEKCFGDKSASIEVSTSGGTQPYLYSWNISQSDSLVTNLGAGIYNLTVTDNSGNGCKAVSSYQVSGPKAPISVEFVVKGNICFNDTLGSIRVNAFGGVPTYSFAWQDTSVKSNINTGLQSGMYKVTITDGNNCILEDSVMVNGSVPIDAELTVLDTGGTGAIVVNIKSGSDPLSFFWTGPGGFRNPGTKDLSDLITQGKYTLKIIDKTGCEIEYEANLAGEVSQEELSSKIDFSVFPNPSTGSVFVDFGEITSGSLMIRTLTGSEVSYTEFDKKSMVEVEYLPAGVYFLTISTTQISTSYKIVFQD